jgi:antitoxin component HigA of HigAB toxin-antitoxin module
MSAKRRIKLTFADLPRGYSELCGVLPPRPIRDKADFDNVVEVTDAMSLHTEDFSDDQQDYFDMLCNLIQTYEDRQVKWPQRSVRQRLQYLANEHGLTGAEISRILGVSRNLGPMILRGDREITAAHARAFGAHFGLPAGIFIE